MNLSIPSALERVAERTNDNIEYRRQAELQRRNQVIDLYGIEHTAQGDSNTPASFYVSVTPDLVYYERFEFKIMISPFAMPVGNSGATNNTVVQVDSTELTVGNTSLSSNVSIDVDFDNETASATGTITPNPHSHSITPNPHTHTTQEHNHSLSPGISLFSSSISDFSVWIEGIDISAYLKAQYPDVWIDGDGIYPTVGIENYDILKAVGYMNAWEREIILQPGYKLVEFKATGTFNAKLITYIKASHTNR